MNWAHSSEDTQVITFSLTGHISRWPSSVGSLPHPSQISSFSFIFSTTLRNVYYPVEWLKSRSNPGSNEKVFLSPASWLSGSFTLAHSNPPYPNPVPGLLSRLCFQAQVLCSVAITNDLSPGELPQLLAWVAHHLWPTGTFTINPSPSQIRHIVEFPSGRDFWVILYLLWSVEAGTEESIGRQTKTSFSAHYHTMCLGSCQLRFLSSEIPDWGLT